MDRLIVAADPYVFLDEKSGYYYSFATSDIENKAFCIHRSLDLKNWEYVSHALDITHEKIWGKDWFWAPECYYNPNNDHYYLFYSARVKDELAEKYFYDSNYEETCKIGVAVSKNIEGPYVNITNEPMEYSPFDFEYLNIEEAASNTMELTDASLLSKVSKGSYIPAIDVNILFEENRMIMYFSRCCYKNCRYDEEYKRFIEASNVACVELDMAWWFDKEAKSMPKIADSFITYDEQGRRKDKFITLISYQNEPQGWENEHVNDYKTHNKMRKNRRWSEGSTIFKVEDRYCLTYSCNCFEDEDYAVGIAFSNNPIGPFKKYDLNPVIKMNDEVCCTGHGSTLFIDGQLYYFLHARTVVELPRIQCYTKLHISKDSVTCDRIEICQLKD